MQESTMKLQIEPAEENETSKLAEQIFHKTLFSKSQIDQKSQTPYVIKNYRLSLNSYFDLLKKLSKTNLKTKFLKEKSKNLSKSYNLKNFYLAYALLLQSQILKFRINFNSLSNNYSLVAKRNLFYSLYLRLIYLKILKLKSFSELFQQKLKTTKNQKFIGFKKFYPCSKRLKYHSGLINTINQVSNLEIHLIKLNKKIFKNLIKLWKTKTSNSKLIWTNFSKSLKNLVNGVTEFLYNFSSLVTNKKQLFLYSNRLGLVVMIYLLPFIFLATQALVPLNEEYQYLIVNPFSSRLFNKLPFLVDLIKFFQPLTTNSRFLIWVPLAYYLTFTSGYRSLKIPYKIAFNGTIASIFLIINYSCVLIQFLMRLVFESINIVKDIFFTSFLIKHLSKNKNRERDEAVKVFANLVNRYDSEMVKNYYHFLLFVNHRIFSHLALISLAALLYNCIYYVIHNKNPEIILVTKTALATIKNPQEEE